MNTIEDFEAWILINPGFIVVKDFLQKIFEYKKLTEEKICTMSGGVRDEMLRDAFKLNAEHILELTEEVCKRMRKECDKHQIFEKHGDILNLMMDHNDEGQYGFFGMTLFEHSISEAVQYIVRGKSQASFARHVLVPENHLLRNKSIREMDALCEVLIHDTKRSFDFHISQEIEADNSLLLIGSFNYGWPLIGVMLP